MMNKVVKFFLAGIAAMVAFSCVEPPMEEVVKKGQIELSQTEVTISSYGETVKVVYQISGAEDGAVISVGNEADWLTVNTDISRVIQMTASKNETDQARETVLTVSCPTCDDVNIMVSQSAWEDPITLTIDQTESTAIIFSVTTLEKDFSWVGQIVGKEWFDSMESDEAIFQEDLSYYTKEAKDASISLKDYLKTIMNKGSYSHLKYAGLDPESEYVVYVYGITEEGVRTTDVYSAPAVTQPPYDGPLTFDIQITEENNIMDVTVTPDHDGVYYYWNLMDRATYDQYASVHGDDPKAVFQAYVDWDIQDLIDYEYLTTRGEYFEWYSDINAVNSQFECMALTEYIIYACKWDADCHFTGEPAFQWYTSADVSLSDNQISVTVGDDVDQSSFFVSVTTTNNDPYVMLAEPSVFMEGMNEEQIYAHLL